MWVCRTIDNAWHDSAFWAKENKQGEPTISSACRLEKVCKPQPGEGKKNPEDDGLPELLTLSWGSGKGRKAMILCADVPEGV